MNSNNSRLKALNLLKLSSIAFLEANEKHGEVAAVAASKALFNDYQEVLSSKEHRDSAPFKSSGFTPDSGLQEIDLDELFEDFPCASKHERCRAEEITDDDVRKLVNSRLYNSNDFDDIDLEAMIESAGHEDKKLNPQKTPKSIENLATLSSKQKREEIISSPPKKIMIQSPSILPEHELIKPKNSSSLIEKINKSYQRNVQTVITPQPAKNPSKEPPNLMGNSTPVVDEPKNPFGSFTSASRELRAQNLKKYGNANHIQPQSTTTGPSSYHPAKLLGGKFTNKQFKSPVIENPPAVELEDPELEDPLLKGIDPKILETIKLEIIDSTKDLTWNDIAGLGMAKETIHEAVVLPLIRPDLFTGLRSIPKGILLFGPPGTGKTLIGKCISAQSKATFFSISASSLTSKWIGEGEKIVKALFMYARYKQPSVIFLDEIDSILTKRSDTEHEATRRLKTEFLIQLEGAHTTTDNDRVLLVGATNRPQELDDAARRRFTKRLYIPLPEVEARQELIMNLMKKNDNSLTRQDILEIAQSTEGYSGADLKNLCADAAMICLRELSANELINVDAVKLRPMKIDDFRKSLKRVKATVSQADLQQYVDWNLQYGSTA